MTGHSSKTSLASDPAANWLGSSEIEPERFSLFSITSQVRSAFFYFFVAAEPGSQGSICFPILLFARSSS
jgi:hypothetical protein